jgi:hypothetical protein
VFVLPVLVVAFLTLIIGEYGGHQLFFNYCSADRALHSVLIQAVSKVDERNTVSPICATTLGSVTQGGLSWTHSFSQKGKASSLLPVCRDECCFPFDRR